jgi:hypothetical protein
MDFYGLDALAGSLEDGPSQAVGFPAFADSGDAAQCLYNKPRHRNRILGRQG